VTRVLTPKHREPPLFPRSVFLTIVLHAVLPAALALLVVCLFVAGLPAGLVAAETAFALAFLAASLAAGSRHRSGRPEAFPRVETLFWWIEGAALVGSFGSFFVFNLEPAARLAAGIADAAVFLLAAGLFAAWGRISEKRPGSGPRLRYPRLPIVGEHFLLISGGALLFAMSFPGFIFPAGCGPLAFVALLPVFLALGRAGWVEAACLGAVYGFLAHALFNFWLATFNPIALSVVLSIRVVYYILLFLLLKLALKLFPRWAFLLQTLLWVGYEFLSAQGFIAYSYGIFGYSQYLFLPLLQTASLAGVWGLSLIVVFPGVYLGNAFRNGLKEALPFFKKTLLAPAAYAAVFAAALVYGFASQADTTRLDRLRVACVQHNIDPWVGGDPAYEKSLRILMRLSERAEAGRPDLVIWPETALVPSLRYHSEVRDDQERYNNIVRPFLEFMDSRKTPYLIGNNDRELAGTREFGEYKTRSYNAAILLSGRDILGVYRKTHLVPFTEHFPYKNILPGVYNWLAGEDTHFYDAGGEADADKVFTVNGVPFSALICFEDTFGEIARRFANRGADLFVNLTNDAWSKSREAETQHLAIAVFRAVENRRSLVRCTTSGITSVIDPSGRIIASLPPFGEGVMVADAPVNRGALPPAAFVGDWFGLGAVIASLAGLAAGLARLLRGGHR
jgi:apolipoprotein N-acyltransferase